MRNITVTEREFKFFMWPAIAYQPVDNGGEVDAQVRLLTKVKSVSTEMPALDGSESEIPRRELDMESANFSLQEDEWGRLKKILISWLPRIAGGILDEFKALQDNVKEAKQEGD